MDNSAPLSGLQSRLDARAKPETKAWWESYLKQVIPFRGVKLADIRSALQEWLDEEGIRAEWTSERQKELALRLIEEGYAEDKLAGILYLQVELLPAGAVSCGEDVNRFARLFDRGHIFDWSTCDWFCVRVLGPMVEREGESCARALADWRNAPNLWRRRAAGVAFVNLAVKGEANFPGFTGMLLEVCEATVKDPQRFAQTGTGWVLRQLARAEPGSVVAFIEANIEHLSAEGLRYATEKMPPDTRLRLRRMRQARPKTRR